MGQSCGGVQAIAASTDPRVTLTVAWNSGLVSASTPIMEDVSKDTLAKLHAPIAYFTGGPGDVAYPNADDDFKRLRRRAGPGDSGVPGRPSAQRHYREENGGALGKIAVSYLAWRFKATRLPARCSKARTAASARCPAAHVNRARSTESTRSMTPAAAIRARRIGWNLAACVAVAAVFLTVRAHAETRVSTGALPDGTAYRIDVPDPWNGVLLIGLDYAAGGERQPQTQALLARGYAMAGTTRLVTGWAVDQSIANQVATIDIVVKTYGKPTRTIVLGASLGAHTGAATIQARPDRFDGAVLMCGGLAGAVGLWNSKLDALFVAKVLEGFDDATLPVIGIPNDFATTARPAWLKARRRPGNAAGRARRAGAVLAQLPTWSDPRKPQPAASDLAGLQAGLCDSGWRAAADGGSGDEQPQRNRAPERREHLDQCRD
jgi:pimeloyl-ACP methyl ester carboxylesterase